MQGQRTKSKSRLLHWQAERTRLQAKLGQLQAELTRLQVKTTQLQTENSRLQAKDAQWQAKEGQWQAERKQWQAKEAQWEAERKQWTQQLEAAQEEGQQSRRSLGLNSSNSGKPPSSDGLAKPPASQRTRSQRRRSGGQKGHRGTTLHQTDHPDRIQEHFPKACRGCGKALRRADEDGEAKRRQVFDLPEPKPEVTEHRALACRCRRCGLSTRAAFPEDVTAPVQYGPRLAATAIYLQNAHFVPEERLTQILRDLFGVSLCPGTLNNLRRRAAEAWEPFVERIREHLIRCPGVKHLDETGFRVAGRGQWLHVLSNQLLTYYRISEKRGGVLAGLRGILVHDHWAPYFQVPDALHALCNAHHLRELEALVKIDGEAWAGRMQRFLRAAKRVAERARKRGAVVAPQMLKRMESRYDELVQEALDYPSGLPPLPTGRRGRPKRRPGHNLALRLERRRAWVLLFLFDLSVPFTNNLGERDLRMMKLLMKISGGFRSLQGAREFVTLRSVLSTARKQGLKPIETLLEGPAALLERVGLAPSLPPSGQ